MMNRGIQSARILHVERFECIVESRGFKRKSRIGEEKKKGKGERERGEREPVCFAAAHPRYKRKAALFS